MFTNIYYLYNKNNLRLRDARDARGRTCFGPQRIGIIAQTEHGGTSIKLLSQNPGLPQVRN